MKQARQNITGVKTIAERLKLARKDAKLTQPALAKMAGVSPGTIGNIESGIRKDVRELLSIAKAVGVNPEWLKSGKGPKSPTPGNGGTELTGWPLSPEVLAALQASPTEVRDLAEAHLRGLLKLAPRPIKETMSAAA